MENVAFIATMCLVGLVIIVTPIYILLTSKPKGTFVNTIEVYRNRDKR